MVNSVATDGRRATLMLSRDPPRKSIGQRDGRGTRLSYTAAAVAVAAAVACDFPRDGAWLQTISTAI